jgi:hypothetical protein
LHKNKKRKLIKFKFTINLIKLKEKKPGNELPEKVKVPLPCHQPSCLQFARFCTGSHHLSVDLIVDWWQRELCKKKTHIHFLFER